MVLYNKGQMCMQYTILDTKKKYTNAFCASNLHLRCPVEQTHGVVHWSLPVKPNGTQKSLQDLKWFFNMLIQAEPLVHHLW